ncbi:sel1 repeat family protein [Peptacetobacter hominis]|uniref:Sel1 repeat family protein n=1 Tax=Peptacetobacter hominis TaxID=2743610 RepID=A0A544QUH5_9FIRM|nr:tetratricopeptide repeat protein [Peptacetobacter hominis]TQQ84335.1 sel1 repeat family protein [Peptacetobacter hominis]
MQLTIVENNQLTEIEKQEIDRQIEEIIDKHRGNSYEISRLVFESVTSLEASNSYSGELESQGILRRFSGMISGKNRDIQSKIDRNLYKSQYASQQILQKLAEQNLMSFELITAVNNKLNSSIIEVEDEINKIYGTLITFFKQTKSDIIQLENRVERLERNINLLNWTNTIEYQMWDVREYSELDKVEKLVCLVRDFYDITRGKWTTSDILLLKSAIAEIGLSPKEKISYEEFIRYILENSKAYEKLIDADISIIDSEDYKYESILSAISKNNMLKSKEKHIVDTITNELKNSNIEKSEDDVRYSLVRKYLNENNNIDIKRENVLFDFVIELLLNVSVFEYLVDDVYRNADIDFKNIDFETLKKYADRNNIEAKYILARIYLGEIDSDIETDEGKGIEILREAAELGHPGAQNDLGINYECGYGVEANNKEAVKWYRKAAEQGDENAQCNLGYMYECGYGVEQDKIEAVRWYRKAAEQGDALGQNLLGVMYECGEGVEEDYKEAVRWYRKAAEQGFDVAQFRLGKRYYYGNGVAQNKNEAKYWMEKAAEQGYDNAVKFLRDHF